MSDLDPDETRPCPACGAPLAAADTHWSLFPEPMGGYVCPQVQEQSQPPIFPMTDPRLVAALAEAMHSVHGYGLPCASDTYEAAAILPAFLSDPRVAEWLDEVRAAALRDLREKVAGLFTPADYVRDNGVDGRLTWPDGWDSGVERVLALIDGA